MCHEFLDLVQLLFFAQFIFRPQSASHEHAPTLHRPITATGIILPVPSQAWRPGRQPSAPGPRRPSNCADGFTPNDDWAPPSGAMILFIAHTEVVAVSCNGSGNSRLPFSGRWRHWTQVICRVPTKTDGSDGTAPLTDILFMSARPEASAEGHGRWTTAGRRRTTDAVR